MVLFSFGFANQEKHNNHSGGNFQENFPQRNPHHPRLPALLWTLLLVRSNRSPMSVVIFQAIAFNIQSWYRGIQTRSCFLPSFPDKDRRAYIPRASNQSKPGRRWNMNIIFPVLEFICAPGLSTHLLNENRKYRCLTPILESRGVFSFHSTFSISFSF